MGSNRTFSRPHGPRLPGSTTRPLPTACATCAISPGAPSTTTIRAIPIERSVAQRASGAVTMLVAIADVDALVREGLPGRCACRAQHHVGLHRCRRSFRCSPQRLSTDLTSLNEGEDRAAIVVDYVVAAMGRSADRTSTRRWSAIR